MGNRDLEISKSNKSEQYFRDKFEIVIRLLDEHFARHFESQWRETWRHTGRRTEPSFSLETLPPPPRPGLEYLWQYKCGKWQMGHHDDHAFLLFDCSCPSTFLFYAFSPILFSNTPSLMTPQQVDENNPLATVGCFI